jgi:hypothetical protein
MTACTAMGWPEAFEHAILAICVAAAFVGFWWVITK